MKKNILCSLSFVIIILCYIMSIPTIIYAAEVNGIKFIDNKYSSAYDIKGIINNDTELKTTYADSGYEVYFQVGDSEEERITDIVNGNSVTVDGVILKITGVEVSKTVINVIYEVTNSTETAKSYKIATTADVELGSNDKAAVFKDGHNSLQLTQDDESETEDYGTQIVINFLPQATTSWIGAYHERKDNKYVDGTRTSYTYTDNEDTGIAYSWQGTVEANGTQSYSTIFSNKLAENGNINFYSYGNDTPTTYTALMGGTVVTPKLSSSIGYTYKWNTNSDGTGTSYSDNQGIIVTSDNMNIYEVRTPNTYTINLNNENATSAGTSTIYEIYNTKYSLASNGNAMTTNTNNITIPNKIGYDFDGYYTEANGNGTQYIDKTGHITSNTSTTNFVENGTLYANWTPSIYTITYNKDNGIINGEYKVNYTYGESVTLPTNLTKKDYIFDGWYADSSCKGDKIASITTSDNGNKEYWAKWEKDPNTSNISNNVVDNSVSSETTNDNKSEINNVGAITEKVNEASTNNNQLVKTLANPKTGDNIFVYVLMFIISIIGIVTIVIKIRKDTEKNK